MSCCCCCDAPSTWQSASLVLAVIRGELKPTVTKGRMFKQLVERCCQLKGRPSAGDVLAELRTMRTA